MSYTIRYYNEDGHVFKSCWDTPEQVVDHELPIGATDGQCDDGCCIYFIEYTVETQELPEEFVPYVKPLSLGEKVRAQGQFAVSSIMAMWSAPESGTPMAVVWEREFIRYRILPVENLERVA